MAKGSMRLRGKDSSELRVYQGIDRATKRQRWATKTVHGSQRFARGQLEDLIAEVGRGRIRAGSFRTCWTGGSKPRHRVGRRPLWAIRDLRPAWSMKSPRSGAGTFGGLIKEYRAVAA